MKYIDDMRIGAFILFIIFSATAARWQKCSSFTAKDINSIKFVSAVDGWIVTQNEIWKTADSGKTWIDRSTPLDSGARYLTSFFLDKKYGWTFSDVAGVQTYYHRTTDGGQSWSKDTVSHEASIGRFFFHDSLHGWKAGMIIYSTDNSST